MRVGIIGYGTIGSYLHRQMADRPELGLETAFVYNRSRRRLEALPEHLVLPDLADFREREPELVVEAAHPDVTREHGPSFLEHADYMPLSLTALADDRLRERMLDAAQHRRTRLFVPHGAVPGLETVWEGRDGWEEVSMEMRKSPGHLDWSSHPATADDIDDIKEETVLYDGPTAGICDLFPRNVNSHAALALGGIGFDRTRSTLIAVPGLTESVIQITARGPVGEIFIKRSTPMTGVSGALTPLSALGSIRRAAPAEPGMQIC